LLFGCLSLLLLFVCIGLYRLAGASYGWSASLGFATALVAERVIVRLVLPRIHKALQGYRDAVLEQRMSSSEPNLPRKAASWWRRNKR